ncbi:unnamed protein product, partial [Scytosiphon promiscuus]
SSYRDDGSGQAKPTSSRRCKAADFFGGDDTICAGSESSPNASSGSSSSDTKRRHRSKRSIQTRDRKKRKDRKKSGKSRKSGHRKSIDGDGSDEDDGERPRRRSKSGDSHGQQLFFEDRRGDPNNLSFGGFYRLDVPLYHGMNHTARGRETRRNGGGKILARYFGGQTGNNNQAHIQLWKGDKRKDHALAWDRAVGPRQVSSPDEMMPSSVGTRQGAHRTSTDFLPVDAVVESLDGDAKRQDDAVTHGEDACTESLEQWVARKTKEFNLQTRERPHSDEIWLEFADFQAEAVRALHGVTVQSPTAAVVRTTLEKKVSVLEAALRRNPLSVRLWTAQLHSAAELQEHAVVDSLWTEAIEKTGHSCTLWLRYLQFKASKFGSFSVPNQRSIYARCMRALQSKKEEAVNAQEKEDRENGVFIMASGSMLGCSKESAAGERNLLDVLWSYCIMEKGAGYQERALGVLQAMVELNVQSSTISMDTLVSYWDSEDPRIGDLYEAGISQWTAARNARSTESSPAVQPHEEQTAVSRKVQSGRFVAGRGKRKRAVDFFKDQLPTATPDQPKGTAGAEVLEKAYHAAMALATVPTPREEESPPNANTSVTEASDVCPESPTAPSHEIVSLLEAQREEMSSGKSAFLAESQDQDDVGESAGPVGGGEGHRACTLSFTAGRSFPDVVSFRRHGYRIDVQGAQDSVSGLEYGRILNQMREGSAAGNNGGKDVQAATAASRRQRHRGTQERDAELARQAAVLEDVPNGDAFSIWAKKEDELMRGQWQPLRSTQNAEEAEEQPERVVFLEDIRPYIFRLVQPASKCALIGMLLHTGGLIHPRSAISHATKFSSEASCGGSFGEGGLAASLISSVSNGLHAVWRACDGELATNGKGFIECTGRSGSCLPPPVVSTAADQFLLLTDEVVQDQSRQAFLRNVLHHLVRAPESLPSTSSGPDLLVQLQCTLIMFEGYLASATGARHGRFDRERSKRSDSTRDPTLWADEDTRGHEARKVAKTLLEASQASSTDLRLWSSYVQLLALLGSRREAIKVAEKALSMVQALPEAKKALSAELFWLTFRLHAGLPLSPRDLHAGAEVPSRSDRVGNLFEAEDMREQALLTLCSFAEGLFVRPKSKKSKLDGKGSRSDPVLISPPKLMAARKLMAVRVAQAAALDIQGVAMPDQPEGALDMTPPFMYYSVAWVWLEYLSRGLEAAEEAMSTCLDLVQSKTMPAVDGGASGHPTDSSTSDPLHGMLAGNRPYVWNVVPERNVFGVCLERMHRTFSELVVLAQLYNPVDTGPRRVRSVLLRGLASFPTEAGMLCMLVDAEQFSTSQQRLVHHMSEVSRRRVLEWEHGPTPVEWILFATHQVMRCVQEAREARQRTTTISATVKEVEATSHASGNLNDEALRVKNWLPGSYSRLKRSMESAVSHPTGRGIPILWRMYISVEAMRGNHIQAKQLFWRAIHACPSNKATWMDALRGKQRGRMGAEGLRPAFRDKELEEVMDAVLDNSFHIRAEPP